MPRPSRPVVAASFILAALLAHAGGCSAHRAASSDAPRAAGPDSAPNWTRPGRPADQLPPPIPVRDGVTARQFTDAVIIDTRDFPVALQVTDPWDGPVDLVRNSLPPHGRDKTLHDLAGDDMAPMGEVRSGGRVTPTGICFAGIAQTPLSPPDPTIAVGPRHIVQTVNDVVAFFTKEGQMIFSAPLGQRGNPGFFEGQGAGTFTFDPKCFYDPTTRRFVITVLEVYSPTEAWIDIAVSDDDNPVGVWHRYRTNAVLEIGGSRYWVDYPGFGFDDNAFYIAGNLFRLSGSGPGFAGPVVRVFDKAPLLTGAPASFVDLVPQLDGSMQVAHMYGPAPRCYMVTRAGNNAIRVWTVNDPLGTPSIQHVSVPHSQSTSGPSAGAPNLNGGTIDTLDGRLMNAHWRNGNLYTAHAIDAAGGGRTRARWYQIDTRGWPDSGQSPVTVQQGNINEDGKYYFFPAIASDKFDRVGLFMARSAADEYASVWAAGREAGDTFGTMSQPVFLAAGDRGTEGRWGDYFDLTMDPNDDRTFWAVGMYAKNFGWQTWIGSFLVGCPADENGDGRVDFFDLSNFLNRFVTQDLSTDIAPPFGTIDFFDLSFFLARMSQGCP